MFWVLNSLLLLASFLSLSTSDVLNVGDVKPEIWDYLRKYKGPNSDQLKNFPNHHASLSSNNSEAQTAAIYIYNWLYLTPTAQTLKITGNLFVQMKLFDDLQDFTQQFSFLYDNSKGEYDFLVVYSTHGIWVFALLVSYGEKIVEAWQTHLASLKIDKKPKIEKKPKARLREWPPFQDEILNVVISPQRRKKSSSPTPLKDNLHVFTDQLRDAGGYITGIEIIQKSAINQIIFTAIRDQLRFHPTLKPNANAFDVIRINWDPSAEPFAQEESRKFFATFFYDEETSEYRSLSLYSSVLGIYYAVAPKSDDREDPVPSDIWAGTEKLERQDQQPIYKVVQFDHSNIPTIGFQDNPSGTYTRSFGPAIILLTNMGYFLVWYPPQVFAKIAGKVDWRLPRDAITELRGQVKAAVTAFKNAQGVEIITLVFTNDSKEDITGQGRKAGPLYRGAFLKNLLLIVSQETKALFGGKKRESTHLIVGSGSLTGVQQRFILLPQTQPDAQYLAIYYSGFLQMYAELKQGSDSKILKSNMISVPIRSLPDFTLDPDVIMQDC